jgi:exopolysaccharide biosynthesis predicted pyruvyltransferase EpsI
MSDNLNHGHVDMVEEFKLRVASGKGDSYMLTVARDGESPARSIYFYADALTAAEGYSAYQDWGFAKDYLTVELYEPTGRVHSKILHRPRGGECTFVRDDYHKAKDIFLAAKENVPIEEYNYLVYEFAKLFSKDNQRFVPERFLDDTGYTGETNDQH